MPGYKHDVRPLVGGSRPYQEYSEGPRGPLPGESRADEPYTPNPHMGGQAPGQAPVRVLPDHVIQDPGPRGLKEYLMQQKGKEESGGAVRDVAQGAAGGLRELLMGLLGRSRAR